VPNPKLPSPILTIISFIRQNDFKCLALNGPKQGPDSHADYPAELDRCIPPTFRSLNRYPASKTVGPRGGLVSFPPAKYLGSTTVSFATQPHLHTHISTPLIGPDDSLRFIKPRSNIQHVAAALLPGTRDTRRYCQLLDTGRYTLPSACIVTTLCKIHFWLLPVSFPAFLFTRP
jgi:hypothetical protein